MEDDTKTLEDIQLIDFALGGDYSEEGENLPSCTGKTRKLKLFLFPNTLNSLFFNNLFYYFFKNKKNYYYINI